MNTSICTLGQPALLCGGKVSTLLSRTGARLDIISAKKDDDSDAKSPAKSTKTKAEAEVKTGESKSKSKSTTPLKEQYCLAVMDFDGKGQKTSVPVKVGDVVIKIGDATKEGWAWVEKVPQVKGKSAKKAKDEPAEAGYVPTWAIEPIPEGSGKDAEDADADKQGKKEKAEQETKKGKSKKLL